MGHKGGTDMDDNLILILFLFAIGLIMLIVGLILLKFYKKKRKRCSIEVTGTVVDMADRKGRSMTGPEGREVTFHQGVYEYEVNGEIYYSPSTVQTTARPKFGKQRILFVNPDNPNEIIEKRFITYLPTGLMFVLCAVMWLITIIVAICIYA